MSFRPGVFQRRAAACLLLMLAIALSAGCQRDATQVPELQGGEAVDARPAVEGFGLVSAGRGRHEGETAIELVFSQPLAASQAFDDLLVVKDADGAVVEGSWVLSDDSTTLRFPYVEPSRDYTVMLRAGLAAADGAALGRDETRTVDTGPVEPSVAFP